MTDTETKTELNYMVWQYLEKESPSLAAKFKKSKKIKPREEAEVTLFNLYDLYIRNRLNTTKRISESEIEKSPFNEEACICQDESNVEDSLTEVNEKEMNREEIKKGNNKEDSKSDDESGTAKKKCAVVKSPVNRKTRLSQKEDNAEESLTEVNEKDVTIRGKKLKNREDSKEDEKSDDRSDADKRKSKSKIEKSPASKKAKIKKMLKNIDGKEGEKSDDESDAAKRKSECEAEKSPASKKARLSQDENSAEDDLTEVNEKDVNREETSQEDTESDEEPSLDEKQKNGAKVTEAKDNKKSLSLEQSKAKPTAESESKKKKRSLLPKPKKKKTLLAIPFSSIHKNDPNFFGRKDRRKTLLPQPSPIVGPPSRRKTLLTAPMPAYSDSERTRKILLPEPLPSLPQHERAKKPLLAEPLLPPPPPLSRHDRMDSLAEPLQLSPLYPESNERVPLLGHLLESDQANTMYRREKRPLLDGPRHLPAHNIDDDTSSKRKVLLPKRPPLLLQEERIPGPADCTNLSDYQLYHRGEAGSSSKPLIFNNEHQRDDSSHLYSRRAMEEPKSGAPFWEDKEAVLLAEVTNYLKRLSRFSGKFSSLAERLTLMDRPTDEPHRIPFPLANRNEALIQKYEEELKSIGVNMTPEMSSTFRRATHNEFQPSQQEKQRELFERFNQKMGFL